MNDVSTQALNDRLRMAEKLADEGLGWEDIRVKLGLDRTEEIRAWLRTLVLKRRTT